MPKINWIGLFVILGGVLLGGFVFLGKESEIELSVGQYLATPSPGSEANNPPRLIPEERNFSDQFAQGFTLELLKQNQAGFRLIDNKPAAVFNPREFLETMARTSLKIYKSELPVISEKDLNIVASSPGAEEVYFTQVRAIINRTFGGFPQEDPLLLYWSGLISNDYEKLEDFSPKSEVAFQELKNLPVPKNWAEHHKKALELLAQAKMFADGFIAWQEDPLRTYVFLQIYPQFAADTQDLLNLYAKHL